MEFEYHSLLPIWAQEALRDAADVKDTPERPRAKDSAIEAALHEIMLRCPECFRKPGDRIYAIRRAKR